MNITVTDDSSPCDKGPLILEPASHFWRKGFWRLVLGIASFFNLIPRTDREGVKAGNVDIGVDVRHHEHVSAIVSTVLVVAGAGMMVAGSRGKRT
jgi:hypothetical protein